MALTWNRYVYMAVPGELKAKLLGLVQVVQSCKGMPAEAAVLPAVPESLHSNPAEAASDSTAVLNTNCGVSWFDNSGGADVIWATGSVQTVLVAPLQPGLYVDCSSPVKLPCTTRENSCGLYGGGAMRKAVTVMTTSPSPRLFHDTCDSSSVSG